MRLLVTGFEPFGGDAENASRDAVLALSDVGGGSTRGIATGISTGILPVEFGAAGQRLHELVREHRPDAVVCVGEAGLRTHVCLERRARNLIDARIPDNAGQQPRGEVIDPRHGDWLETPLDVVALAGADAVVSEDAGLFVCNYVYFTALAELDVPAVFVHVPAVRTAGRAGVGAETDVSGDTGELPTLPQVTHTLVGIVERLRNGR